MKIITANRLVDGAVVYLDDADEWVAEQQDAALFENDDAPAVLAAVSERITEITDAYLADVDENGALAGRSSLRETIRRQGPTIRTDLGYQAGQP